MTFYGNNDWRDYLAHYGVKGMKWDEHKYTGVVNGEYVYGNNPVTKQATTALISKAKHVVSVIKKQKKTSGRNKIVGNRKGPFYDPIYESDVKKEKDEKSEKSADYDKNLESLARDAINGKYGAGDDRKKKLESMGVSYAVVQNKVNELLGSSKRHKVTLDDETRIKNFLSRARKKRGN